MKEKKVLEANEEYWEGYWDGWNKCKHTVEDYLHKIKIQKGLK